MVKQKKRLPLLIAALAVLTALAFGGGCKASEGDAETEDELALKTLNITFDWGGENLVSYLASVKRYGVKSVSGNTNFTVIPVPGKAGDTLKMTRDGEDIPLIDGGFTLPVLDIKAVKGYDATLSVSRAGKTVDYIITVNPPAPPEGTLEEVEKTIKEAEQKVAELTKTSTIVLGDPSLNSPKAKELSDLLSELNKLKGGTVMERLYMAIDSTGKVEEKTEQVVVYDTEAINSKLKQLNTLAANFTANDTYIRINQKMFNFKGAQETVLLDPVNGGVYEIEVAGGSGGTMTNTTKVQSGLGGKGGHVTARFSFPAGQSLTVRVGGQGESNSVYDAEANDGDGSYILNEKDYTKAKEGGWPNGGTGGQGSKSGTAGVYDFASNGTTFPSGTGGGGGTDVILGALTGDFDYTTDNANRIIVAGGGGGNTQRPNSPYPILIGGIADSTGIRNDGIGKDNSVPDYAFVSNTDKGVTGRASGEGPPGGTNRSEGNGGGGGGYLGGGAYGSTSTRGFMASGAGGTNYISSTARNDAAKKIETAETIGNGWAKITWISAPQ